MLPHSPLPQAAKIWFRFVVSTLIGLLILYLFLHSNHRCISSTTLSNAREEIVLLQNSEFNAVVTLLNGPDSLADDTTWIATRRQLIVNYLLTRHTFRDEGKRLRADLTSFKTRAQLRTALDGYPMRVKSFFWLADTWIYTEILFWSIFGVLASLLYSVSEALRSGGQGFDRSEVPSHWAKVAYTPFSVLIIYLAISLFGKDTVNNAPFSAWQIVLAFVLGFFSRRTMDLLDRIKDLLFAAGNRDAANASPTTRTFVLRGRIQTNDGQALTNAAVKLIGQADASHNAVKSPEADGTFAFEKLPAGTYHVVAELPANPTPLVAEQTVKLDGQNPEPFVELTLTPVARPL
ncbi:MAG: carboxypeptidase-like regulatory domain-containing protein [Cytophagaceae bacterium]|nr:carboxypeptidase-like regulatory domain-containing protein [Cytophagaceae bacterium]